MSDIENRIHAAIDWSRCVVGGSDALQKYTRALWAPNDKDVMCATANHGEFLALMGAFVEKLQPIAVVDKILLLTPEMRAAASAGKNGGEERFHESIIATSKITVGDYPVPVQLIGIDSSVHFLGRTDIVTHLNRLTDLPACVSYSVKEGACIFHVPDRGLDALATKTIPATLICAARKKKYEERGYSFV
jgi:hypothetical protein